MLTPRPYQIVGRDFLAGRRFALLADEMRVGKTPQAILAAEKLNICNVIVVCPAIAVPHWTREWSRWGTVKPVVYSYDKLRLDTSWRHRSWDLAIVDECHFAKNPDAQRTKLVYGKGGLGYCSQRMWSLSGTPATKHAAELWPMLYAYGVCGLTYSNFIKRYCTVDETFKPTGTKVGMIPELRQLLARIMLRRTRKEVAPDMPDIGFEFLEMPLDAGVDIRATGETDDDLLRSASQTDGEDRIAVATAKAAQLAGEIDFVVSNGLLKQTVVFGWHREPLRGLTLELILKGIVAAEITGATSPAAREIIQRDFRNGDIQVICANIKAAGTAIDLSAASHGYFLELHWTPADNLQAANRLISLDKHEPVTFDVCTSPGTVDDRVQRILVKRMKQLKALGIA